jgi:hypothetical protein
MKKAVAGEADSSFPYHYLILLLPILQPGHKQVALFGFLVALSSTAIVLKMLGEWKTDSPHGRVIWVFDFSGPLRCPLCFLYLLSGEG